MSLTTAAEVLEDLAHGRLPEQPKLSRANASLIARYRAALCRGCASQGLLFQALGLVNHAVGGALPCLSSNGRARALRLASDVRLMPCESASSDARIAQARTASCHSSTRYIAR